MEQWQTQETQYQAMLNMRVKLEARLTSIRQQREQLRSLIELAEAKQVATRTIKSLDSLAAVGDKEVSSLADQVRARLDEEDARLDMATRNIAEEIEEAVGGSEVERQLEERRRRLLGGQQQGGSSS
jgi:phage shock protein A